MALLTKAPSFRGIPSSVKPAAPAAFKASMSVSSCPPKSLDTAPQHSTWIPVFFPSSNTYRSVSTVSTFGWVFAMQITVVNPPWAAAAAPVWISSL